MISLLLALAATTPAVTQDTAAALAPRDTVTRRLEARAARTDNVEELGQAVVRQSLLAVARRPVAERSGTMMVNIPVAVRIWTPPSPSDIDVCFEISTGLRDYIECDSPVRPIEPDPLPSRCDELSRAFQSAANNASRFIILREMMALSCIELRRVRIALVR